MASTVLAPYTSATLVVPASSAIATWSNGTYLVQTATNFANYPPVVPTSAFNGSGAYTSSAYTAATTVTVSAGGSPLYYNVGTGPVIFERPNFVSVGTLNATGTLTGALIMGGKVTSTTAAAVTATLDTGAVMDALASFAVGDAFLWSATNTGGVNAFTVTAAASGHTVVGSGTVAASSSGTFLTTKTAAATFVTYRQ